MTRNRLVRLVAVILLISSAAVVFADESVPSGPSSSGSGPDLAGSMGEQAFKAWLAQTDLGKMVKRDRVNLTEIKTPLGVGLEIKSGFRHVLVIQKTADRAASVSCISTEAEAETLIGRSPVVEKQP